MKMGPKYKLPFKRRFEGKTDYRKRLALIKSGEIRLVVRKSNKHTKLQIVKYQPEGDRTLASASTQDLIKLGWKYSTSNTPSAYLAGLLMGIKARKNKLKKVILDIGPQVSVKGSKIYAAVKGVIDAGIEVPCSEEMFPPESRIKGENIVKYAKECNNKNQFSKIKPVDMVKDFEKIKEKILKG
ncbi:MAG: 50S ribosomal protein L18 [Candidatus Aenigmatarchaeota archaeon]